MSVFNIISEWGYRLTSDNSFFSNFFWSLNRPFVEVLGLPPDIATFFDDLTTLEFALGFGLSFFLVSHVIKLVRQAYLI